MNESRLSSLGDGRNSDTPLSRKRKCDEKRLRPPESTRSLPETNARRQRNAAAPIHSLPTEILLEILLMSIQFEKLQRPLVPQLHRLARVCAHWFYLILGESRFWHVISVSEKDWVEKVLAKNPSGPLAVRADTWASQDTNVFLKTACEHSARWERLTVRANLDKNSIRLLEINAPRLKRLSIRHIGRGRPVINTIVVPILEDLELDNVRFPWDSPTLSGLKHLSISHIRSQLPTFMQLVATLQASPQLQSFGLKSLSPVHGEDVEELVPRTFNSQILLPALEGLVLASPDYPITRHLPGWIEVPNCHLLRIDVAFDELVRPGSTAPGLYAIPLRGKYIDIAVRIGKDGKTAVTFSSPSADSGAYERKANSTHYGGLISISDVPYGVETWSMLLETLEPVVEWGIYPLSLTMGHGMDDFAAGDIGFWDSATSISFLPDYPHTLSALQYLSRPTVGIDGVSQWPCSEVTSLSFFTRGFEPGWDFEITPGELASSILGFVENRMLALGQGGLLDSNAEGLAPMGVELIAGDSLLIEELRGKVPKGVRLDEMAHF